MDVRRRRRGRKEEKESIKGRRGRREKESESKRREASIQYSSFSEKKESCSLSSADRRERERMIKKTKKKDVAYIYFLLIGLILQWTYYIGALF
jgi:hypothetical protein